MHFLDQMSVGACQDIHAIIIGGLVPVADGYLSPADQQSLGVANDVVRYPFDLAKAESTLRDIGIVKGPDGPLAFVSASKNVASTFL